MRSPNWAAWKKHCKGSERVVGPVNRAVFTKNQSDSNFRFIDLIKVIFETKNGHLRLLMIPLFYLRFLPLQLKTANLNTIVLFYTRILKWRNLTELRWITHSKFQYWKLKYGFITACQNENAFHTSVISRFFVIRSKNHTEDH